MRHAKAESFAASDAERELTARGRADAAAAGGFLAGLGLAPDHALVSSAARARATWAEVAAALGSELEPVVEDAVYQGSGAVVVDCLQQVTDASDDAAGPGTVMLVGHNPAAAWLAHLLDDGSGDSAAGAEMARGFPAGAVAVLEVAVTWPDLAEQTARLIAFHAPAD
jgi:phosphohistidine phosphatase